VTLVDKKISDMHFECSLQTHNFKRGGTAMSDCCRRPATAAVIMPNGDKMWRCGAHYNVRSIMPLAMGPWVFKIKVPNDL